MSDLLVLRWRQRDPAIVTRWRGPDGVTQAAAAADPQTPLAAIIGAPGRDGADQSVELVSDVAIAAGMPVFINRGNGRFGRADAGSKPQAFVAGLASADVAAGFVGQARIGRLTLSDWSVATGGAALLPGQLYFLAVGGGLTTTPPGYPNCVTRIGIATSASTLIVSPEPPLQL